MRGAAPAWVVKALGVIAVLTALGRVDAIETNALTGNLDGVAVDDRCPALHRPRQRFCPICYRALEACGALLAGGALDRELGDCGGKRADAEEDQTQERSRQSP
ncbi:hypothetical protein [Mesorhizobium sp.]|uniref:hypothetical protein n=1 Tax=Mesorhizobium sp. TaxID=1871066 RepID=UPI00257DEEAB|nr:hypothetical protein [Mesorhizobium sp.]